jgi:hypothetical protein
LLFVVGCSTYLTKGKIGEHTKPKIEFMLVI